MGESGQLTLEVLQTTTYALKALFLPGQPILASATVRFRQPGFNHVSPGSNITAEDLAEFNAHICSPRSDNSALPEQVETSIGKTLRIVWEVTERTEAMVRMYDLTHDYATSTI